MVRLHVDELVLGDELKGMEKERHGAQKALQQGTAHHIALRLYSLRGSGTQQLVKLVEGQRVVPACSLGHPGANGRAGERRDGGDIEPMRRWYGIGPRSSTWE